MCEHFNSIGVFVKTVRKQYFEFKISNCNKITMSCDCKTDF